MIESTYSVSSFCGFVSSKRRLVCPPNSSARPKSRQIALACPMCRYPFGSGGKRVTTDGKRRASRSSMTASRMKLEGVPRDSGSLIYQMVSPHRVDEAAPAELRVGGAQRETFCTRGGGDNAVDRVPRELVGELHDEERHGRRDLLDHHACFLDQPSQRRLRSSVEAEPVMRHQPGHFQNADGSDGEPARLQGSIDGRSGSRRESPGARAEPKPRVGVEEDHRFALRDCGRRRFPSRRSDPTCAAHGRRAMSHSSKGGKMVVLSTSPMMVNRSAMQPNTPFLGASGGTSLATGLPFLVMTTGVRYFLTSSITRRHRALNSPAGIVFMVSSTGSWSPRRDHVSTRPPAARSSPLAGRAVSSGRRRRRGAGGCRPPRRTRRRSRRTGTPAEPEGA